MLLASTEIWPAVGSLLLGLVLLASGADLMVRGASVLALRLKLTPAVVGLTIVALGTSLPELMVSVAAQLETLANPDSGAGAIAWGNVIGSNVFNIGMVLGFCSLLLPLTIPGSAVRMEWPFMAGSTILIAILIRSSDGNPVLDRMEGAFLLLLFVAFTAYVVHMARREVGREEKKRLEAAVSRTVGDDSPVGAPSDEFQEHGSLMRGSTYVVLGCLLLAYGGDFLIDGAASLALNLGMTQRVVSSVVVAALTGAPEFVTTLMAVKKGKSDMAVANVVGSNIFNTLAVLGTASVIAPLEISEVGLLPDLGFMLGISLILGPFLLGKKIGRVEGVLLLAIYGGFLFYLFYK